MALQIENGRQQRERRERVVSGGLNGHRHDVAGHAARQRAPVCHRAERLLQVNLAALTALGTLLLGMGERNLLLPVLAVIVAVSSVYLTDVKGWLQLNTFVANVAGVIALAVTWREWNNYAAENQLLSLANLLIYLQFVLLYRKKTVRNYWLLLLLTLLQVAVAAALNMSVSFGVLLPAYMFIGLLTMSLFVIYRAQAEHAGDWPEPDLPPSSSGASAPRWPLARRRPVFQAAEAPGASGSGLGWSFYRQMVWLGAATCLFALVWFFGLPRSGKKGPWRPSGIVPYTSVGFAESVTLDQLGEVYENPEEVMQVKFRELGSSEDFYRIGGDSALFRGSVLYDYERGRWRPLSSLHAQPFRLVLTPEEQLPKDQQLVREEINIQGRNDSVLFTVVPAFTVATRGLNYSTGTEQLLRSTSAAEKFHYELVTTAFRDHIPVMAFPADGHPGDEARKMPAPRNGVDPLAGLRAEAAEFAGGGSTPLEQTARNLESHLRHGYFQYSLKQTRRALGVDPVEAFITQHRTGHCEYFASALVLMLRSVDIPARLAIGFKGGEWNVERHYYQIRELHAHAWVEAYVGPDSLPANLSGNRQAQANGAWLVLDPTPGQAEEEVADTFGMGALKRMLDLTQLVWTNYVLGMDSQRQQEAIYQPLVARLEDALRGFANEESRERLRRALAEFVGQRIGLSQGLFSRQGLLTVMVGVLLLVGLWKMGAAVIAYVRRRLFHRPAARRRNSRRVEFYERFEALLARYGMPRTANQTQREFAVAMGGYLADSPRTQQVAGLPRRIADAFYLVRFGRRQLDNNELSSVERAISDLAVALAERHAAAPSAIGFDKT